MKICAPLLLFLLLATCSRPEGGPEPLVIDGVRFVPMRAERLPDMHHPRSAHILEETGGLVLAAGGHTTGFIPEKSAEYLKDGKWVEVDMLYPHDAGFGLPLRDGRILLGGGYGESFGISQSWGTELWDPASRQFRPFPIMDRKRAHGAAVELAEGKIAVSGNWYNSDGIGVYSPGGTFNEAGWSTEQRSYPYMLRSDSDNALIFSSRGTRYEPLEGWVDRVYGDGFFVRTEAHVSGNRPDAVPYFLTEAAGDGERNNHHEERHRDGYRGQPPLEAESPGYESSCFHFWGQICL